MIEGVVVEGRRLGRRIGFPTANIAVGSDCPLADGVYAIRACVGGVWYRGVANLGCNPSVGGNSRRLESHLFGFGGSLYGLRIRVELLERIREERHFDSLASLQQQIEADKILAERLPFAAAPDTFAGTAGAEAPGRENDVDNI